MKSHRHPSLSIRIAPLALGAALAMGTAQAQETLQEVLITATPLRTTALETAQPVLLLSGDLLRRALATNLGDTLANQPGLSSTSFGPIASRPVIRGQGGLRVQLYQDGAETLDVAALSEDHAVSLDPSFANRIEVLHGPAALMYGSASAAGAINVVTDRLALQKIDQANATRLELRGDSANEERALALRSGGDLGGNWQWRFDGFSKRSGDLSIADFVESPARRAALAAEGEELSDERGELHNTDANSEGGSVGLGWSDDHFAVALSLNGYRSNYGLPEGGHAHAHDEQEHADDHSEDHADHEDVRIDLEQRRVDLASEWRPTSGWIERWSLRLARNDYEHAEIEDGAAATRYGQLGYETRLTADRRADDASRGVIGLQYRDLDFAALGDEAFLPPSRTRSLGVFFFEERRLGAWLFEAGARWERQTLDAEPAANSRYRDDAISASIGSVWSSSPQTRWSLQLTRTQRHPTATELYADGEHLALQRYEIGDADLGVETARTADFAWRFESADAQWQAKVSLFVSDYRDYIFAAPLQEEDHDEEAHAHEHEAGLREVAYRATDARFHGIEAEWSINELAQVAQGRLGIRVFGDLVRARDVDGHPLPQIPPLRIGGELHWVRDAWRVGVESLWHDAQTRLADNELRTDGYNLLAADIAYRHEMGAASMLWFVRGQNLLDEDARRHASPLKDVAPLAGRSLSAGVRVEF